MLDDPEERPQRCRIGIDAADAEQIEMNGSRQMIVAIAFDRPQIDEAAEPAKTASSRASSSGVTSRDILQKLYLSVARRWELRRYWPMKSPSSPPMMAPATVARQWAPMALEYWPLPRRRRDSGGRPLQARHRSSRRWCSRRGRETPASARGRAQSRTSTPRRHDLARISSHKAQLADLPLELDNVRARHRRRRRSSSKSDAISPLTVNHGSGTAASRPGHAQRRVRSLQRHQRQPGQRLGRELRQMIEAVEVGERNLEPGAEHIPPRAVLRPCGKLRTPDRPILSRRLSAAAAAAHRLSEQRNAARRKRRETTRRRANARRVRIAAWRRSQRETRRSVTSRKSRGAKRSVGLRMSALPQRMNCLPTSSATRPSCETSRWRAAAKAPGG